MAEKKTGAQAKADAEVVQKKAEAVYTAEELAHAAARMGTKEECIVAALDYYDVKEATIKDAEAYVKKFLAKEVK